MLVTTAPCAWLRSDTLLHQYSRTGSDYETTLMLAGLDTLESRPARLTERFSKRNSSLNYLLPNIDIEACKCGWNTEI